MRFSYIVGKSGKFSLDLIWLTPVITILGRSCTRPPDGYRGESPYEYRGKSPYEYRGKSRRQSESLWKNKNAKKIAKQAPRMAELLAKTAALKAQGNIYMNLSVSVAELLQYMKTKPNDWKLDTNLASLLFSTITTTMEPVMIPENLDMTRLGGILKAETQQKLSSGGLHAKRRKAILSLDDEIPLSSQATEFVRVDTTLIREVIQSLENKEELKEVTEFKLKKGSRGMKQVNEIVRKFNLRRRKESNHLQNILVSYAAAAESGAAYKDIFAKLITAVCNTRMSGNVPECVAEWFLHILKINLRKALSKLPTGKHHYVEAITASNHDFGCGFATEDDAQLETPGGPCKYEKFLAVVESKYASQSQPKAHKLKLVASLAQQSDQSYIDRRLERDLIAYPDNNYGSPNKYKSDEFLSIFDGENLSNSTSATCASNFSNPNSCFERYSREGNSGNGAAKKTVSFL